MALEHLQLFGDSYFSESKKDKDDEEEDTKKKVVGAKKKNKDDDGVDEKAGKEVLKEMAQMVQQLQESLDQHVESIGLTELTLEDRYFEAMEDAMMDVAAYGPYFEALKRDDKEAVKGILKSIRPKVFKHINDTDGVSIRKPISKTFAKRDGENLAGIATNAANVAADAVMSSGMLTVSQMLQEVWLHRLWQTIGVVHSSMTDIGDLQNSLNETFKTELKGYKLYFVVVTPGVADCIKSLMPKKGFRYTFLLIIDKKLDPKIKADMKKLESAAKKEAKGGKKSIGDMQKEAKAKE